MNILQIPKNQLDSGIYILNEASDLTTTIRKNVDDKNIGTGINNINYS